MRGGRWLEPEGVRFAILFAIGLAIANGIWILIDDSVPAWDQSHYLRTALAYQDAFTAGGPLELLRSIERTDPSHGPLFTVLILPFISVFGPEPGSALALNLAIAPVLYFSVGQIAWTVFGDWRARLLAMALVGAMPLMVGLFHNVLQDFLLVTLTALSLLLLLQSERFSRRGITVAMAFTMGLGTLTKVTFPLFVIGPFLVVVVQLCASLFAARRQGGSGSDSAAADLKRLAITLGAALLVFLMVAFVWYGPNFTETIDYIRSTTSGPLAEGAGPEDPLTFNAITAFTLQVINFNLTWIILLVGLAAVALNWERLRALFRRPLRWTPLGNLAFLIAWAAIPYLSVVSAHNQDVRLMAPAFPAVAILVAGAVCAVRPRAARLALTGFAVVLLAYQTINHVTDVTPGFMPDRVTISAGDHAATMPLSSEPIGYEVLPGEDLATPVIEYVERVAAAQPGGNAVPRTICLLQSEAAVNSNTFSYLASARELPYQFADVVQEPGGTERELEEILSGCNFALYVKQPPQPPSGPDSRLTLVNQPYAAHRMTPRLFSLFQGPSKEFPISSAEASEGEAEYLSAVGSDRVTVLVRTAGEGPNPVGG